MSNLAFAEQFKARTKKWTVSVLKYLEQVPDSPIMRTIRFQLIKSATSTSANYRAVCRSRSNPEFFAKISICIEEADESIFWLELMEDCGISKGHHLEHLLKEGNEILSMLISARKTIEGQIKK